MRGRPFLPTEVRASIREHLASAVAEASAAYESANEDEDALTGDFCGSLRTGWVRVSVAQREVPQTWRWRITYHKFRGRGPRPTERTVGADGIIELSLSSDEYPYEAHKSLLFQAKMLGDRDRERLWTQAIRLSTWREASFVLLYAAPGFRAVPLDDVLTTRGAITGTAGVPVQSYLGERFLECLVGDDELLYDGTRRRLIWRAMGTNGGLGDTVAADFDVRHRARIEVEASRLRLLPPIDRYLAPNQVHSARMYAEPHEILDVNDDASLREVAAGYRRQAPKVHPDPQALGAANLDLIQILTMRMRETNLAREAMRAAAQGRARQTPTTRRHGDTPPSTGPSPLV